MSDTHRHHDRYRVECDPEARALPYYDRSYRLIDTEHTDDGNGIVRAGMTRTAALNCCSRLNGRDMYPDYDRTEDR